MNIYRKILVALCLSISFLGMALWALSIVEKLPASLRSSIGYFAFFVFCGIAWLVSATLGLQQSNAALSREMAKLKTEMEAIKKARSSLTIR
jgi:hypothetical protein